MLSIYDTNVLIGTVRSLVRPQQFLLDLWFPFGVISDEEKISFDVQNKTRRLSPFVAPIMEGRVVEKEGFTTNSYSPAYVKDKRPLNPTDQVKRKLGERIAGDMSPAERQAAHLVDETEDQMEMLMRRQEHMAVEAVVTGQNIITGHGYGTHVVQYGRDAALDITLAGGAQWSQTTAKPLSDIRAWSLLALQKSGAHPVDVVMDPEAFMKFIEFEDVQRALDTRRGGESNLELGPQIELGGVLQGTIGNQRYWTYQDWYVDEAGVEHSMFPVNTVLLGSAAIGGTRYHGAIKDADVLQAMELYPKTWVQEDPSVRWLMMQSAPLMVPTRPNAVLRATVAAT